ncbi:Pleiotropic drug resistance protein [Wickerhamomyces ciferrii]|uniref:Pleiotropic drug resistance protein n=1 Tax=Wickerhamomyces ciferrii (strain ATCC 14091 / BCRC 22168 / CBS 111 / JCM 3599 / NBRC 0793 / NRRL Y-1031 F-60-10) TaxID=1206466 RepID=K0KWX9_WICCF|nr:Pleiotropic drug resistance protein [Wickerhamomyces ciferrii]CCH46552.1 Pleiotropic drug resistance protein [Wickerhamomyces ciferrii]
MNTEAINSLHHNDLFVPEDERVGLSVRALNVTLNKRRPQNSKVSRLKFWNIGSKSNENEKAQEAQQDIINGDDAEVQQSGKRILNNINLDLQKGKVLAILGSSGSGKTTLLNTLASRMSFAKNSSNPFHFEGMVQYSQKNPNISYLLQEDLFMPGLTVRETLKFTAQLKLPNSSNQEINNLINYLFDSLDLKKIENTIINNFNYISTLSGGEKRRVSLAIQLLTKPSVLFLDEPTTGLDSNTSIHLVQTVKDLAANFGITIILTIHQPRSEILDIVDEICLLARGGSMLYTGSLDEGQRYFESLNLQNDDGLKSEESNFADFLLSISSIDKTMSHEVEMKTQARVTKLIEQWKQSQILDSNISYENSFESGTPIFDQSKTHKLPLYREIWTLGKRSALLTFRDLRSMIAFQGLMTILAIVCGWVFYKPGGDLAGIRSVTSTLYVCCEVLGFTPLLYEIERLCATDGKFFVRDYKEGIHSITGFLIARKIVKLILEDIPITLTWSVITFFMWGLNGSSNFGIYFVNNFLIYLVGMATAIICFMLGNYEFGPASLITNYFYQLQNSACGYFVNSKTMPVYVKWTKYLANFWYAFGSMVSDQFTDYVGDCPYEEGSEACYEYTGEYVLDNLGFPRHWYATPLVVNMCWFLGFYIASGIILWYQTRRKVVKVVKPINSKIDHLPTIDEEQFAKAKSNFKQNQYDGEIIITLKEITLSLKKLFWKNMIFRKHFEGKQLLKNVESSFKPGVNAIMGPSGSGKTTLLNFLTGRTRYSTINASGDVMLNDKRIPFSMLKSITTYVVQDDSVLIPTLTVRETLWYQAKLRLDKSQHQNIPHVINDLIRKMGLSDVANIPIGDSQVKGISGGEKRRVSIAIQLLNNSKILLLDEPTSGLDSFTSSSIISLLNELAISEKKTIILTIHQPKYEIFEQFDNILLLSNGSVIYDGTPNGLIDHFAQMGFKPDYKMNFADYILDVISNRGFGGEDVSQKMINGWKSRSNANIISTNSIPLSVNSEKSHDNLDEFKQLIKTPNSFKDSFGPVLERQFKVLMRSPDVLWCRLAQLIGLGVIHALYFSPLKNNSESIMNRLGLIQEVLNLYFIGLINCITAFPIQKETFYQEFEDNTYSPLTFMLCYLINEIPFEIVGSFIFTIFIVLVIGLPRTGGMFFSMFYMCVLTINTGESVGMMFTTIFDHLGLAVNFVSNLLVIGIFMGGTMSINMPILFKAFNYINPLKYAVLGTAKLGLQGQKFTCSEGSEGSSSCSLSTGEQVMKQYKLDSKLFTNFIAIAVIVVVYRLVAHLILEVKVRYLRK